MSENEIDKKQKKIPYVYSAMCYNKNDLPEDVAKRKGYIIFVPEVSGFKAKDHVEVTLKLTHRPDDE